MMTTDVSRCLRGDSAPCQCGCPFHLDIRALCDKARRGGFDAAYNLYRNAVALPEIVAALCDAPCRARCKLAEPIDLQALERAAIRFARRREPLPFRIPPKEKTAAVIGAGAAGLAFTLRLASKGYAVTLYERGARWGGTLADKLPEALWTQELDRQFQHTKNYTLLCGHAVAALDELTADAVFIATGRGGADFGLLAGTDAVTGETARRGVFLGGELAGGDTVRGIASALRAARYAERFLMTGRMLREGTEAHAEPGGETRLAALPFPAENGAATPRGEDGFAKDAAKDEAARCLRCDCGACLTRCDFLRYARVEPRQMAERVAGEFISDGKITEGNARRLADACSLCGACAAHCPEGIDLGEFLLESRRRLHREEKLPPAWHEFWLRDMAFSASDAAALCRAAPAGRGRLAFFPGCALGAAEPRYVLASYRFLLQTEPDTALLLNCCGAPALWAGAEAEHAAHIKALRAQWEALGRPELVLACPSCQKMLARTLPEIPTSFLWERMAAAGLRADAAGYALFDPCAARELPEFRASVRALAPGAAELPCAGAEALCCGYGGQTQISNPGCYGETVKNRAALSALPYLCACVNCRESFAAQGKGAAHLLDLLFGLPPARGAPGASARRENRRALKRAALAEFFGETQKEEETMTLVIDEALRHRLDAELILDDDIRAVIERCEAEGDKLLDPESGAFTGHAALGCATCWVEYAPEGAGFRVRDAYVHRLEICERRR